MSTMKLTVEHYAQLVKQALAEDLAGGDVTTAALIAESARGSATIRAKADGILAGVEVARNVFYQVDPELIFEIFAADGSTLEFGVAIARISGKVVSILKAERTALNFLQHLSGIATETASYVRAIEGLPTRIVDTRKTIPGLRVIEKYAVSVGGGKNHRMHLGDAILIKDNHIKLLGSLGLNLKEIIESASRKNKAGLQIEVEVKSPQEAASAAAAGANIIMLDNMNLSDMRKAVQLIGKRCIVEASGGINLYNVRAIAETGVDIISVGALTHSARALDINMKLD